MTDLNLGFRRRAIQLVVLLTLAACTEPPPLAPASPQTGGTAGGQGRAAPRRQPQEAAGKSGGAGASAEPSEPVAGRASAGSVAAGSGGQESTQDAGVVSSEGSPAKPDAGTDAGAPAELISEPEDEARYIFDQAQVRTYRVSVDAADLARIDQQPSTEEWIPAHVELDGVQYGPFTMRYKGAAGSFRPPCTAEGRDGAKVGKCSFKLGFDEVDPELRLYGLKALNFQAMNTDASMLRERLGYSLFRDFGLAAPRAVHARVFVNGAYEGLFVVVEQVDGRFTRARFAEGGEGNLYKEVWPVHASPEEYFAHLKTNEDENPSVDGMLQLRAAIGMGVAETAKHLDRDYMLRYLAVDRVTTNDDGALHFYCQPGGTPPVNHNYYWYQAEKEPRFWLIPWDMDQSFHSTLWAHIEPMWSATTACTCNMVYEGYQFPASCDPLVRRFIQWLPDYEARVDQFLAGPFSAARVNERLETWSAQLERHVREAEAANRGYAYDHWQDAQRELRDEIELARKHRGAMY